MAYPPVIQAILDGGDIDPTDFTYGNGSPSASAPQGTLYVDLDTKDVYQYASGTGFDVTFSLEFETANPYWSLVWNLGDYASIAHDSAAPGQALEQNIQFTAGDSIDNLSFFFPGICYTPVRPFDTFTLSFAEAETILTATQPPDDDIVGRYIAGEGIADNSLITAVLGTQIHIDLPTVSAGSDVLA